jgi:hypothetical protein
MADMRVFIGFSWLRIENLTNTVNHYRFAYYVKEILVGSPVLMALTRL